MDHKAAINVVLDELLTKVKDNPGSFMFRVDSDGEIRLTWSAQVTGNGNGIDETILPSTVHVGYDARNILVQLAPNYTAGGFWSLDGDEVEDMQLTVIRAKDNVSLFGRGELKKKVDKIVKLAQEGKDSGSMAKVNQAIERCFPGAFDSALLGDKK